MSYFRRRTMNLTLANGKSVDISQAEIRGFISQILMPNAYWRHSGQLSEEEVMRFLKRESNHTELKKIARYILTYTENLAFTAYLFDKADGERDHTREFNMPALERLRELYRKVTDNRLTSLALSQTVNAMESICLEIGADPL